MWFDLEPSDLAFVERAPFSLKNEAVIDASPARVFEIFATGEAQTEWFKDFKGCRWLSDAPYGVGSIRVVELKVVTVRERFLAREPGRRLSFSIDAITLPFVKAMVEDIHFEPAGDDKTRLSWRVYYDPSLVTRLLHPIVRAVFGGMFTASTGALARYAARKPR